MDPMVRSRRGTASQGEPGATGACSDRLEREYSAALSQADPGMNPQVLSPASPGMNPQVLSHADLGKGSQGGGNQVVPGEASPNTLEQGGAGGGGDPLPLPTASPFHSIRIQEEVELIRRRPVGLGIEQARLEAEKVDPGSGLEPNYSLAFGGSSEVGPRVARVEAAGPTGGVWPEAASTGPEGEISSTVAPVLDDKAGLAPGHPSGLLVQGQDSPEDETPELLPDSDRTSRLEQVVSQLIDENRSLKRRVEQAEWRSQSSWHSGTPGEAVMASPMSFAVEGGPRFGEPVQPWSELGRFIGFPPNSLEGASSANFPGLGRERFTQGALASGEQQLLGDAGVHPSVSGALGPRVRVWS